MGMADESRTRVVRRTHGTVRRDMFGLLRNGQYGMSGQGELRRGLADEVWSGKTVTREFRCDA